MVYPYSLLLACWNTAYPSTVCIGRLPYLKRFTRRPRLALRTSISTRSSATRTLEFYHSSIYSLYSSFFHALVQVDAPKFTTRPEYATVTFDRHTLSTLTFTLARKRAYATIGIANIVPKTASVDYMAILTHELRTVNLVLLKDRFKGFSANGAYQHHTAWDNVNH